MVPKACVWLCAVRPALPGEQVANMYLSKGCNAFGEGLGRGSCDADFSKELRPPEASIHCTKVENNPDIQMHNSEHRGLATATPTSASWRPAASCHVFSGVRCSRYGKLWADAGFRQDSMPLAKAKPAKGQRFSVDIFKPFGMYRFSWNCSSLVT